jgi:hypothetical protein
LLAAVRVDDENIDRELTKIRRAIILSITKRSCPSSVGVSNQMFSNHHSQQLQLLAHRGTGYESGAA